MVATHPEVLTVIEDIPNGGCGCCQDDCGSATWEWDDGTGIAQWLLMDDSNCNGTPVEPDRSGAFIGETVNVPCHCGDCPGTCAYEWNGLSWVLVDDPNDCTHGDTDPITGLKQLCACEPPPMLSGLFVGELYFGVCGIDSDLGPEA